jgi:hypothetical protein
MQIDDHYLCSSKETIKWKIGQPPPPLAARRRSLGRRQMACHLGVQPQRAQHILNLPCPLQPAQRHKHLAPPIAHEQATARGGHATSLPRPARPVHKVPDPRRHTPCATVRQVAPQVSPASAALPRPQTGSPPPRHAFSPGRSPRAADAYPGLGPPVSLPLAVPALPCSPGPPGAARRSLQAAGKRPPPGSPTASAARLSWTAWREPSM